MIQLGLFPPPAAPDNPLPEKARREAGELLAELLIAVIDASAETRRSREGDGNG
jgi:hypothetical protein